ncbi:MAG TPA: N-acetyl-gamma-glutamyl-phosphate reductase [Hyphomicrobiales bacterium]|nr:N-acetyl-gamma-glutamyl-phosphate reductase [Hyphomicrobiales bacterium]
MEIKAGIVGATGYTGVELLRFLALHPQVRVEVVTSRAEAGLPVAGLFPNLRKYVDLAFTAPDVKALSACDVVFFATPNGTAMTLVPALLEAGVKVIDLSADFRIKDVKVWEQWYKMTHACPQLLEEAVYGLCEINRDAVRGARLLANPGCYPTSVQLGFMPLLKAGVIDPTSLIADCKSGTSGAGRKAELGLLHGEVGESFKAYAIGGHRHLPEIKQGLNTISASPVELTFLPHLVPMIRGIHASLYARLTDKHVDLQALYEDFYRGEPFVDVLPPGVAPETRWVRGSNHCQLAVCRPQQGDTVVVLAVEDNLVKGAAGQAVQNMNLMFSLPETTGLNVIAALP